jgi:NCAIR mutase (PurE)-related protein
MCNTKFYKKGENMKTKISMTIDLKTFNEFKELCEKNGYKISTRVEHLIKQDILNRTEDVFYHLNAIQTVLIEMGKDIQKLKNEVFK